MSSNALNQRVWASMDPKADMVGTAAREVRLRPRVEKCEHPGEIADGDLERAITKAYLWKAAEAHFTATEKHNAGLSPTALPQLTA